MNTGDSTRLLEQSLREHIVLTGRVTDIIFGSEEDHSEPLGSDYFVITWQDGIEIRVPLNRFSGIDLEQKNRRQNTSTGKSVSVSTTMKRYLLNRKGSEFDFIVTHIPYAEDGSLYGPVIADRLAAMDAVRREFWFQKDDQGEYIAVPGKTYPARVVDVAPDSIRVELKGIERILYRDALLACEHEDIRKQYRVGDSIWTEITKVTLRDEDSNRVKAQLCQTEGK